MRVRIRNSASGIKGQGERHCGLSSSSHRHFVYVLSIYQTFARTEINIIRGYGEYTYIHTKFSFPVNSTIILHFVSFSYYLDELPVNMYSQLNQHRKVFHRLLFFPSERRVFQKEGKKEKKRFTAISIVKTKYMSEWPLKLDY